MRINTNVSSLTAQEAAQNTSKRLTSSLEKLSTGLRINKASDDASGLAIADKLRTQATSINQGIANGNSAVSLLQIADKSMAEQSNILDTIKSKLIQANTDTTSADGRESIRKDIAKLLEQLDNIAEQTNYNGNVLLQKSATDKNSSNSLSFQVGETNRDMITNAAIQSNTDGLGSKTSYGTDYTLKSGNTASMVSATSILVKADNEGTEKVTLNGDVDSLTLAVGAKVSNVDSGTAAKLDALVASGKASLSAGTYTIGSTAQTLDLSAIDNVKATVETGKTESFNGANYATGQVIDVRGVTLATGSTLNTTLNDSNEFTMLATGLYVAVGSGSISSLSTGESFKLITTTNVDSGAANTQFNAGDQIKVNTMVTGGLLEESLKDGNSFKANADGTYTVLQDFTAAKLRLMESESITVTQGTAVALPSGASTGHYSAGVKITGLKYNPGGNTASGVTAYQSTANFSNIQLDSANTSGTDLYAGGEDTLSFHIAASGQLAASPATFNFKAGDIISGITDNVASAGADQLSSGIYSSSNFVKISTGRYQALTSGTLKLTGTDNFDVTRLVGGSSVKTTHTFDNAGLSENKIALNDQSITFKAGSAVSITNEASSAVKTTSASEMSNGKDQLSAISALGEGELTSELAAGFQSIVDDAITKLNGYRGDIGSTQNQVESAVRNLMTQATNVKAAESIIRDVDYAAESANFNKLNIISQGG